MSLIDSSYAINEYLIVNVSGTNPTVTANAALLAHYITRYEPEYMKMILGVTLYDEFIAGLAVTPTPDAKWTALKAKFIDSTNKISPIMAYVWNRYWTFETTKSSSMGQSEPKVENATIVSSNQKLVLAWNDAMYGAATILDWLLEPAQIAVYTTLEPDYDSLYLTNNFGI